MQLKKSQEKMVLQAQLYPHGGFQQQGYIQEEDYYSKNGYAHKEDYYSKHGYAHKVDYYPENGYHNSGSSIQMRPNPCMSMTTQPPKHHAIGHEGYAQHDGQQGKHKSYMHESNGWHGKAQSYNEHDLHGYGKYLNGMHHGASNGGYENHPGAHMHMGPNRCESMSYSYYGEGCDSYSPYYEQHKDHKDWASRGAEWISKGIDN